MNNSITDAATAAIVGAAAKYGTDLLSDTLPGDADDALRMAHNLIARLRIVPDHGAEVATAVADIVDSGEDPDRIAGLRAALAAAVADDGYLASDLAIHLSEAGN
jgi:hypothetical protein